MVANNGILRDDKATEKEQETTVKPLKLNPASLNQPISKDSDTVTYKFAPKRHRISLQDAESIATLVATRKLTETEACYLLEIKPSQWFDWKDRNKRAAVYEAAVTRIKAAKLEQLVTRIEDVGQGIGVKYPDWRASAWLTERLAPDRFAQNKGSDIPMSNGPTLVILHDTLKRITESIEVESSPAKLLSEGDKGCLTPKDEQ